VETVGFFFFDDRLRPVFLVDFPVVLLVRFVAAGFTFLAVGACSTGAVLSVSVG